MARERGFCPSLGCSLAARLKQRLRRTPQRESNVVVNETSGDISMESQTPSVIFPVNATLRLGSETYYVHANKGVLSEQLVSMKEESMNILKDFITKHNVPNDVPDEPDEASSDDDGKIPEKVPLESQKRKCES